MTVSVHPQLTDHEFCRTDILKNSNNVNISRDPNDKTDLITYILL